MGRPTGREAMISGAVLFVGVVQFALAVFVAEFLYPGYSVSQNTLSDLGATCNKGSCQIFQPSSYIFNSSIILGGILVLISAFYIRRAVRANLFVGDITIAGSAMIGVGLFPETFGIIHGLLSAAAFLSISVAAIIAYRLEGVPLSYLSVLLGAVSLVSAVLYLSSIYFTLGQGGMERMIVYPVLLWSLAFSGQLITDGQAF